MQLGMSNTYLIYSEAFPDVVTVENRNVDSYPDKLLPALLKSGAGFLDS